MNIDKNIKRPPMRYFGGKWQLAPRIIELMPAHHVYCEPFAGGASVFLRKPVVADMILADADEDIVNALRFLTSPDLSDKLDREFDDFPPSVDFWRSRFEAWRGVLRDADALLSAKGLAQICLSHWAHGGWVRGATMSAAPRKRSGTFSERVAAFKRVYDELPSIGAKLAVAEISCAEWQKTLSDRRLKRKGALVYADPPYLRETRTSTHGYTRDMSDELSHRQLLLQLLQLSTFGCKVMVSGYRSELYDDVLRHWRRVDFAARTDASTRRTECVWCNFEADASGRGA